MLLVASVFSPLDAPLRRGYFFFAFGFCFTAKCAAVVLVCSRLNSTPRCSMSRRTASPTFGRPPTVPPEPPQVVVQEPSSPIVTKQPFVYSSYTTASLASFFAVSSSLATEALSVLIC